MNRLVIKRRMGVMVEINVETSTGGFTSTGRTLEEALRKAAVRAGLAETQDELRLTSTFEAAELLEKLLGGREEPQEGTGDMGLAHA